MAIVDFVDLMCDSSFFKVEIYDLNQDKIVFSGMADEIPDDLLDTEVSSFDSPVNSTLCINIE